MFWTPFIVAERTHQNVRHNAPLIRGLVLLAALLFAPAGWAGGGFAPDQVVVRLVPGGNINLVNLLFGTSVLAKIEGKRIYLLEVPEGADEQELLPLIEALPDVQWAELNILLATMEGTTGSFFVSATPQAYYGQYATRRINPAYPPGTVTARVAVLDTGVDASHAELADRVSPEGYDFVDGDSDPADTGNGQDDDGDGEADELVGHGTHIAGVVALVAANAEIFPVRVLNDEGAGYAFQVAMGIYWAIDHEADIINLSMVSPTESKVLATALESSEDAGVMVVAAAGNLNQSEPWYPAGNPTTVAVAATDTFDHKSPFSNYGAHITISAPGTQIVSTLPGGLYGAADGTSFSAAFVSAAAATLRGVWPEAPPAQIAGAMAARADSLDGLNPEFAGMLGGGRLDITAVIIASLPYQW